MTKIVQIGILSLLIISCNKQVRTGTYKIIGNPTGILELSANNTYKASYGGLGFSYGSWKKKGRILSIWSKYHECCIDTFIVNNSKDDSSTSCTIKIMNYENQVPDFIYVVLGFSDTLIFDKNSSLSVSKGKYDYIQLIQPIGVGRKAISKILPFRSSDTVTISYNYVQDPRFYRFYFNEKYKIDSKKMLLEQKSYHKNKSFKEYEE